MSPVRLVPDELIEHAAICRDACVRKWPILDLRVDRSRRPLLELKRKSADAMNQFAEAVEIDHPTRGNLSVGRQSDQTVGQSDVKRSPLLGEHTDEIQREVLGFSNHQVAEIHDSGGSIRRARKPRSNLRPTFPVQPVRAEPPIHNCEASILTAPNVKRCTPPIRKLELKEP